MAKKKDEQILDVRDTYTRLEEWINDNQKLLSGVAVGLLVLVAAFAYVKRVYLPKKEKEAANEIFTAQQYFQMDSFNLALQGDGEYLGFDETSQKTSIISSSTYCQLAN